MATENNFPPKPASEADIRPPELKKKLAVYLKRDRERWLSSRSQWVNIPCPACGDQGSGQKIIVREYPFTVCGDCGTVYHNPRPTPDLLEDYYTRAESYSFWAENIYPATEDNRRKMIAGPMAVRLENTMVRENHHGGLLVEIGAGAGLFLDEARIRNLGEKYLAIEPNPSLVTLLRKRQFEIRESMAEGAGLDPASVSTMCAFEVIEHVFSPLDFLSNIATALQKGGLAALSCPNIQGFDFQILGYERAENFGFAHMNMFHPASLSRLLERCGFTALEIMTPGRLDADLVRRQILNGRLDVSERPFLRRVLVDEWESLGGLFQEFLRKGGLSSNMVVMARKD